MRRIESGKTSLEQVDQQHEAIARMLLGGICMSIFKSFSRDFGFCGRRNMRINYSDNG